MELVSGTRVSHGTVSNLGRKSCAKSDAWRELRTSHPLAPTYGRSGAAREPQNRWVEIKMLRVNNSRPQETKPAQIVTQADFTCRR